MLDTLSVVDPPLQIVDDVGEIVPTGFPTNTAMAFDVTVPHAEEVITHV